jgi:DNA-binding MurR/RpiR family transcriptional regulator
MLTEWLETPPNKGRRINECLILIDVVHYAREAPILARLCNETDRSLVIVTDEMCHWAKSHTDLVIHASTRSGLFLDSTVAITAALNLIVHAVAKESSAEVADRLQEWRAAARALNLF